MTPLDHPLVADITAHQRVNNSLLAPLERPLLRWLGPVVARRADADACTLAGVAGAVLCFVGYTMSQYSALFVAVATGGVVLHWLGDSLDGTAARLRGADRPRYGFYVDHFADSLCQVLIFLGLGLSPYVGLAVACVSLVAYQSITIVVFLRTAVLGEFQLSFGKIGPTEGHALLVLLGLAIMIFGSTPVHVAGLRFSAYDIPVAAFGVLAAFHFLRVGLRDTLALRARNE